MTHCEPTQPTLKDTLEDLLGALSLLGICVLGICVFGVCVFGVWDMLSTGNFRLNDLFISIMLTTIASVAIVFIVISLRQSSLPKSTLSPSRLPATPITRWSAAAIITIALGFGLLNFIMEREDARYESAVDLLHAVVSTPIIHPEKSPIVLTDPWGTPVHIVRAQGYRDRLFTIRFTRINLWACLEIAERAAGIFVHSNRLDQMHINGHRIILDRFEHPTPQVRGACVDSPAGNTLAWSYFTT